LLKPLIMTNNRLLTYSLVAILCVLFTQIAFSQNKVITGKINDDKGNPLQGATVVVKGSKAATSTDVTGSFSLSVPASAKTLVITSVGFSTQEIDITDKTSVTANMVVSSTSLNDVVVVGYGTARKKDVTGAVSNITAKDFTPAVTSPMEQIQGKVPGLSITIPGGDPNQNVIIRLRGQASLTGGQTPLIVLDGVPLDDPNQIANIPPNDIASYDVLKDASAAAIYGTRGANGVIIINTKKGVAGKTTVEYNGFGSVDKVSKNYPLLDLADWKAGTINYLTTNAKPISVDSANTILATYDKGGNTDWQNAIDHTAYTQSHNLAISGGTGHFNYRASLSYINQQGIIINSGKEGVGLRINAEQKAINDKLDIQVGIVSTSYTRKLTDYSNLQYVFSTPPSYPVYNPDGSYYAFSDFAQANPVEHLNEEVNQSKEYLTQLSGIVNYAIIPQLKVGVTGSISHFNKQTSYYAPPFPVENTFSMANAYQFNTDSKKGDFHVNYLNTWGKHNLGITGVYEYNYFTDDNFGVAGQQYLVNQLQGNFLGGGNSTLNVPSSYKDEFYLISYLGRVTYNYDGRFYVTGSYRRDGSSKFGVDNRYGNFPSIDIAWAISRENFMRNVNWVSFLKIRAGYGVTGNQDAISPYNTLLLLSGQGHYFDPTNPSNQYPQTYSTSQNQNPDLKWEERHGRNIGLDFSLFNNIISGDVNYFNDETVHLLYNYTLPSPPYYTVPPNNTATVLANVGNLTNKGFEVGLTAKLLSGPHVTWTAGGQITFVKTRVTNLSGSFQGHKITTDNIPGGYAEGRGLSSNPITFLKLGYAPYVFYLPHYKGVDKNGSQLFDSAGVASVPYNNATNYYIDPSEKFNYGISTTVTYDNFSLTIFLRGVSGQKIFNNTALDVANITRLPGNNVFKDALTNGIRDNATASDLYLENASYMRFDNLTLGYTFNKVPGFQNLHVYLTGRNLFVITAYKGLDPEVRTTGDPTANNVQNQAYIDATYGGDGFYPRSRTFTIGVNLAFQ
jgi:TonB-dependent starch-binding outer membrane protein SusC